MKVWRNNRRKHVESRMGKKRISEEGGRRLAAMGSKRRLKAKIVARKYDLYG